MRQQWMQRVASYMIAGLAVVLATGAAAGQGPCQQIKTACDKAGFVADGAKDGKGIWSDCLYPILQGKPQRKQATKPLPTVDPQVVAACKEQNPNFGPKKGSGTSPATDASQPLTPPADSSTVAPPSPPAAPAPVTPPPAHSAARTGGKPNIIFILTDDLAMNLVQYMPNVLAMQRDGTTFAGYFVTDSLCCPSRSSIFTGKFPHNTGVFTNTPPDGGYVVFNAHGNDSLTFALALQRGGYQTAMMGKYLNGYLPGDSGVPAGWNEWDVAGNGYPEFNYNLNENGKIVKYGNKPEDYLTDVLAGKADAFIRKSESSPFFIEIATFAPHAPYIPAPRDASRFPGLIAPQTAAFGARPDETAPKWLKEIPPLGPTDIQNIDKDFRMRVQSVQAVDKMIGQIRATLAALGDTNTYVIFSSDNGYHMGEYSLRPGKMTPFDTDIQVPLVVVGPGVAKGRVVNAVTENVDLAPTFTEIAGAAAPTAPDGHSLISLLHGSAKAEAEWRHSALIEHRRPGDDPSDPDAPMLHASNPTSYEALRMDSALYVEYEDGETGYYDLKHDPEELKNISAGLSAITRKRLHDALTATKECKGTVACWAAQRLILPVPK